MELCMAKENFTERADVREGRKRFGEQKKRLPFSRLYLNISDVLS